jgi:hypothetical protein
LRFWNHEVLSDCDGVVETILARATEAPPTRTLPTASRGEGDSSAGPSSSAARSGDEGELLRRRPRKPPTP